MSRKTKPKTVFMWRDGARFPVSPQVAGEFLARLARETDGEIRPRIVAERSRPEDAPLHAVFEWDDVRAATLHRDEQARSLIRSVRVVTAAGDGDVPAMSRINYVVVARPQDGERVYVDSVRALADVDSRRQVLAEAITAFRGLRKRYEHLEELGEVRAAIDRLEDPGALAG